MGGGECTPLEAKSTSGSSQISSSFAQDPGLFMACLDVEAFFTNIPLEEIMNVCCDSLFSNYARVNDINKIDFKNLKQQLYKTTFSFSKENFINELMEKLWDLH